METQLRHDLERNKTVLRGRLKLTSVDDVVFRNYTSLDIHRSEVAFDGYLRGFMATGGTVTPSADTRLRVGVGARYNVSNVSKEKVFVGPIAKKEFLINKVGLKRGSILGKVRAGCDFDVSNLMAAPSSFARALVSYKLMRFNDRQDVKLTAGCDVSHSPRLSTSWRAVPFAQVRENNWAVTFRVENLHTKKAKSTPQAMISYDL
eukprot:TRINITY_DN71203_c0_g1_i1.p1 TRINITY_DN71203_c0_g1~~TRINITY_DN71203_c0_g1_i1.p1  ORF type:complete len:241 (-),score=12.63 TRINITY_DN71203_c0_g1_i1:112-726(-)